MKTITITAIALGLVCAGPALAETYRSIQGSPNNVVYIVPESVKKTGGKAQADVVAILENPNSKGMIAQQMTMTVDCGAKTFQRTLVVDLDINKKELARRPEATPAAAAPAGSMVDKVVSFSCSGPPAGEKAVVFNNFTEAVTGTKGYIIVNREAAAKAKAAAPAK